MSGITIGGGAVDGQLQYQVTTVTGNYTASLYDNFVVANALNNVIQVSMPLPAVAGAGTSITVVKSDTSGNAVTVSGLNALNKTVSTQGNTQVFVTDGVNWY